MRTDANAALPELKDQTFHPFTDLLLHDMGEGWPTIVLMVRHLAPSGALSHSGALVCSKRSMATNGYCMTGAPAVWKRPFSGTAAKPKHQRKRFAMQARASGMHSLLSSIRSEINPLLRLPEHRPSLPYPKSCPRPCHSAADRRCLRRCTRHGDTDQRLIAVNHVGRIKLQPAFARHINIRPRMGRAATRKARSSSSRTCK